MSLFKSHPGMFPPPQTQRLRIVRDKARHGKVYFPGLIFIQILSILQHALRMSQVHRDGDNGGWRNVTALLIGRGGGGISHCIGFGPAGRIECSNLKGEARRKDSILKMQKIISLSKTKALSDKQNKQKKCIKAQP